MCFFCVSVNKTGKVRAEDEVNVEAQPIGASGGQAMSGAGEPSRTPRLQSEREVEPRQGADDEDRRDDEQDKEEVRKANGHLGRSCECYCFF